MSKSYNKVQAGKFWSGVWSILCFAVWVRFSLGRDEACKSEYRLEIQVRAWPRFELRLRLNIELEFAEANPLASLTTIFSTMTILAAALLCSWQFRSND